MYIVNMEVIIIADTYNKQGQGTNTLLSFYIGEISMKEKRIEKRNQILQKIVDRLQLDNQELKNENKQLQEQFEVEKNKCLEKEKQLDKCIEEYQKLIEENKKIKERNLAELNNLGRLKNKYNKKMNKIVKSIRF